jgi:hypothetical protein
MVGDAIRVNSELRSAPPFRFIQPVSRMAKANTGNGYTADRSPQAGRMIIESWHSRLGC